MIPGIAGGMSDCPIAVTQCDNSTGLTALRSGHHREVGSVSLSL